MFGREQLIGCEGSAVGGVAGVADGGGLGAEEDGLLVSVLVLLGEGVVVGE